MTLEKQRKIAIAVARGQLTRMGYDPQNFSAIAAMLVLEDLCLTQSTSIASRWYLEACSSNSKNQITLFSREWKKEQDTVRMIHAG